MIFDAIVFYSVMKTKNYRQLPPKGIRLVHPATLPADEHIFGQAQPERHARSCFPKLVLVFVRMCEFVCEMG